jgi:hypothetical protein
MSIQFTSISGVINHSIDTTIGSVAMPTSQYAKGMIIKTRNNTPFRICQGSGGASYFSVGSMDTLSIPLSGMPAGRIMWARTESGTDTLEILLFNT